MSNIERPLLDFNPQEFVASLHSRYEAGPKQFDISAECLARCTGLSGKVLPERFDAVALALARGYSDASLPFAFCDAVVNIMVGKVYSDAASQRDTWPPLFWEVFLAFDAGEFFREGEEHIEPAEKYTRPLIEAIVARFNF